MSTAMVTFVAQGTELFAIPRPRADWHPVVPSKVLDSEFGDIDTATESADGRYFVVSCKQGFYVFDMETGGIEAVPVLNRTYRLALPYGTDVWVFANTTQFGVPYKVPLSNPHAEIQPAIDYPHGWIFQCKIPSQLFPMYDMADGKFAACFRWDDFENNTTGPRIFDRETGICYGHTALNLTSSGYVQYSTSPNASADRFRFRVRRYYLSTELIYNHTTQTLETPTAYSSVLAISPSGRYTLYGRDTGSVVVVDEETGQTICNVTAPIVATLGEPDIPTSGGFIEHGGDLYVVYAGNINEGVNIVDCSLNAHVHTNYYANIGARPEVLQCEFQPYIFIQSRDSNLKNPAFVVLAKGTWATLSSGSIADVRSIIVPGGTQVVVPVPGELRTLPDFSLIRTIPYIQRSDSADRGTFITFDGNYIFYGWDTDYVDHLAVAPTWRIINLTTGLEEQFPQIYHPVMVHRATIVGDRLVGYFGSRPQQTKVGDDDYNYYRSIATFGYVSVYNLATLEWEEQLPAFTNTTTNTLDVNTIDNPVYHNGVAAYARRGVVQTVTATTEQTISKPGWEPVDAVPPLLHKDSPYLAVVKFGVLSFLDSVTGQTVYTISDPEFVRGGRYVCNQSVAANDKFVVVAGDQVWLVTPATGQQDTVTTLPTVITTHKVLTESWVNPAGTKMLVPLDYGTSIAAAVVDLVTGVVTENFNPTTLGGYDWLRGVCWTSDTTFVVVVVDPATINTDGRQLSYFLTRAITDTPATAANLTALEERDAPMGIIAAGELHYANRPTTNGRVFFHGVKGGYGYVYFVNLSTGVYETVDRYTGGFGASHLDALAPVRENQNEVRLVDSAIDFHRLVTDAAGTTRLTATTDAGLVPTGAEWYMSIIEGTNHQVLVVGWDRPHTSLPYPAGDVLICGINNGASAWGLPIEASWELGRFGFGDDGVMLDVGGQTYNHTLSGEATPVPNAPGEILGGSSSELVTADANALNITDSGGTTDVGMPGVVFAGTVVGYTTRPLHELVGGQLLGEGGSQIEVNILTSAGSTPPFTSSTYNVWAPGSTVVAYPVDTAIPPQVHKSVDE